MRVEAASTRRLLTVVFGVALALRAAFLLAARADPQVFGGLFLDEAFLARTASSIRAGHGAGRGPYLQAPLYPYLLALFSGVDAPPETTRLLGVRAVQLVLGAVTCALTALAARRIAGARAGWIAGLLLAVYGPAVHYESLVLVEGPQALCLIASAVLALGGSQGESDRRRARRWLAVGLVLGAAATLRGTALAVVAALVAWLGYRLLRAGERRATAWLPIAALAAGTILVVAPFTLRNLIVAGEPVLLSVDDGVSFWVGNHAGASGVFVPPAGYDPQRDLVGRALAERLAGHELSSAEASRWWLRRAFEDVAAAPGAWLVTLGRKALYLLGPREIPQLGTGFERQRERFAVLRFPLDARWILLLALAAPLALRLGSGRAAAARASVPYVMALSYGAVIVLFFVTGRFRAPVMPLAAVLFGCSADALATALGNRPKRGSAATLLVGLLVLGLASTWVYRVDGPLPVPDASPLEARQRGLSLLREGRLDEAIGALRTALQEGESATTRTALGMALAQSGRVQEAERELLRALELAPDSAQAALELGNLRLAAPRATTAAERLLAIREAERLYRLALAANPRFAEAWFNLGVALLQQGRFEEALPAVENALRLGAPDDPWRAEAQRALEITHERRATGAGRR